ncbi:MAG: RsmD family RNA methyltransferase [Planctomycetaceae bacterium]|jgi:16S rRNA (guanine966-N2)-methyltransferase|nr:RsmD family RNA methyltransferase [Planctomycetaceae bacterium]
MKKRKEKKKYHNQEETFFEIDNNNQGIFVSPVPQSAAPLTRKLKNHSIGSEPAFKEPLGLRIIGGRFRGSKLQYIGDNRVRPMKDRVREAVFNLIGPDVRGRHVVDLFAGTGALTIEAISRGAVSATVIEIHFPTAALLRQNLESLGLLTVCEIRKTDAFFWAKNQEEHPHNTDFNNTNKIPKRPWIVFCSPPYDFYVNRQTEILEMFYHLLDSAPLGSLFVVESDNRFNFDILPVKPLPNKIKSYPPAEIAIFSH